MASTYSPLLRTEMMGLGDQAGNWNAVNNSNIGTFLESAIAGTVSHNTAGAVDTTLSALNGTADEARSMVVKLTGAVTGSHNVICPTSSKIYLVYNATTGAFTLTFKTTAGTGVIVPQGAYMFLYCDGTNVVNPMTNTQLITPSIGAATGTSLVLSGTASATQYTSTIATGTAPLVVASTTEVANLHAATATLATTATTATNQSGGTVSATTITASGTSTLAAVNATNITASGTITRSSASGVGVQTTSTTGNGIYATSGSAEAVYGISTSGSGVYGQSTSGPGVRGISSSTAGVSALSTSGAAGFFQSTTGAPIWMWLMSAPTTNLSDGQLYADSSGVPFARISGSWIPLALKGYTVASLPAGVTGMRAYITDYNTLTASVGAATAGNGGGTATLPVFYNGSAWVIG